MSFPYSANTQVPSPLLAPPVAVLTVATAGTTTGFALSPTTLLATWATVAAAAGNSGTMAFGFGATPAAAGPFNLPTGSSVWDLSQVYCKATHIGDIAVVNYLPYIP